jgi:hypothetical protein
MIKVYEFYSQTSYESIRLASQYFGVNAQSIKDNLNGNEIRLKGKRRKFTTYEVLPPNPYKDFIKQKGLKHMLGAFYLNKNKEVYLWSKKKQEWYTWKTTKFNDGNIAFKTKIKYGNSYVDKWVNVNQYWNGTFGETKNIESPF